MNYEDLHPLPDQNEVNPDLAQEIKPKVSDVELKEQLRKQELRNRAAVTLIMEHTGGPLRLKHKDVEALKNQIITTTHVAMALEKQLQAATQVLAAQEQELETLREKRGGIWTPPTQ